MRQLVILLVFIPALSFSQASKGSLKVFIENAQEDDIIGATVQVMDGERQVTGGVTDFEGFLFIPNIEAGTYTVVIRNVNFGEAKFQVTIKSNSIYELKEKIPVSSMCPGCCFFIKREPLLSGPFVTTYESDDVINSPSIYRN